jgi:hypothetical protein
MGPEPDRNDSSPTVPPPSQARRDRPRVLDLMVLIAGLAFGIWIVLPDLRQQTPPAVGSVDDLVMIAAVMVLGGLSVVGPPLLLADRRRRREQGPWQAGKVFWFASGTSAWLLWPPVVVRRFQGQGFGGSETGVCFAYGTPLMAVYVVAALLAGGWFRKSRRRRIRRSWRETFGLLLGLAWACTGLYLLVNLYRSAWGR